MIQVALAVMSMKWGEVPEDLFSQITTHVPGYHARDIPGLKNRPRNPHLHRRGRLRGELLHSALGGALPEKIFAGTVNCTSNF